MSGGSYNYLFINEPETSLGEDFARMREFLFANKAEDAAALMDKMQALNGQIVFHWRELAPLMRAVEWYESRDSSYKGVESALADWRADKKKRCCSNCSYWQQLDQRIGNCTWDGDIPFAVFQEWEQTGADDGRGCGAWSGSTS